MRRAVRGGAAARRARLGGVWLTARGVVFVVASGIALIAAYALGLRVLLTAAIMLAALPLGAMLLVRSHRPKLSVTRSFSPHVIEAGSAATVTLLVRNLGGSATLRAQWWDERPWGDGHTTEAELPVLQPRGARFSRRGNSTTLEYELRPPRRGIFSIGPFSVRMSDAFGLATSTFSLGEPQDVVVTPEVVTLAETGLSVSAGDGESRLVQRRSAGDNDDSITREYRTGDAMRRVHWRATARHGDLMVRQEEQRSFPEARVLVDTRGIGYGDLYGDDRTNDFDSDSFEWAVRMLASVAVHLRRYGFLVTVEETGTPQIDLDDSAQRTWHDEVFLSDLAALRLTTAADAELVDFHDSEKGRGSNGPIIAIVGMPDHDMVEWMLRRRRPGDLAVAFLVQSTSSLDALDRTFGAHTGSVLPNATELLADAGWVVIPVGSDDDHAAAWEAVVFETGRSRVGS
ncbi:DUF58 domain-containing protein [Salinibacterium sp.]|uniref:DUF58 domain-containing protein n=1 Tax=Salinibacterium sp. TaxID=1915057 RepID=UPI00286C556E|nr:DUF58 domain-containing protein [Salinibacterium sp.]